MANISNRSQLLVTALLLAACGGGCAQTRRYNVQVLNSTNAPITIGLAKEGDPFEPHLASPEQAAIGTPSSDENVWPSTVIDPGRVGSTRVEGKFASRSELLLRVYAGRRSLSDVLAISRGSGDRAEAVLRPEPTLNKFVVAREAGLLRADSVDRLPTPPDGR